jgi:hypothetical protein
MKILVAISLFIVCLNLSAQKEKYFASKWHNNSSVTYVPDSSDFAAAKNGVVFYTLSNDEKNIYVDVKVTESIEQNKVLQMGMTIWINMDGKSKKETGIRYPIGAKYSKGQGRRGEPQMNDPLTPVTPLSQANTISLIGFKDVEQVRFPSKNSDNIRGSVRYDDAGNLFYALTIPLEKLPVAEKGKDGKVPAINFAIEYGAPPPAGGQPGGPTGYTPPPAKSGGGNRSGGSSRGGSSGGGAPGGSAGAQEVPQPVVIWMKDVRLAEKK